MRDAVLVEVNYKLLLVELNFRTEVASYNECWAKRTQRTALMDSLYCSILIFCKIKHTLAIGSVAIFGSFTGYMNIFPHRSVEEIVGRDFKTIKQITQATNRKENKEGRLHSNPLYCLYCTSVTHNK